MVKKIGIEWIDDGNWSLLSILALGAAMAVWGACGSLLDSLLGGVLQASVVDLKSGKVMEGQGGEKVLVNAPQDKPGRSKTPSKAGRRIVSGRDILSNNGVNLLMASSMAVGAILLAGLL